MKFRERRRSAASAARGAAAAAMRRLHAIAALPGAWSRRAEPFRRVRTCARQPSGERLMAADARQLDRLFEVIASRKGADAASSSGGLVSAAI